MEKEEEEEKEKEKSFGKAVDFAINIICGWIDTPNRGNDLYGPLHKDNIEDSTEIIKRFLLHEGKIDKSNINWEGFKKDLKKLMHTSSRDDGLNFGHNWAMWVIDYSPIDRITKVCTDNGIKLEWLPMKSHVEIYNNKVNYRRGENGEKKCKEF